MNRYGFIPQTIHSQRNFNERNYANNFGYYNDSDSDSESESEDDSSFGSYMGRTNAPSFGRMNLYDYDYDYDYDSESESESGSESESEDESSFGYSAFGYDSDSDSDSDSEFGDSEFGKKIGKSRSNAARAMKMAHREGISLKQAWAKINGKKTKAKKKTTKKTKAKKKTTKKTKGKKKSYADAKKAMKLHHQKGITLKAAWKIVKKGRK